MTVKQLEKRVQLWTDRLSDLGLAHWRFHIKIGDEPGGSHTAHAGVTPSSYYDEAEIEFSPKMWEECDERGVDEVIVHELVHVVFRDYNEAAHSVCDSLSDPQSALFHDRLHHELEGATERFARALVSCYYS